MYTRDTKSTFTETDKPSAAFTALKQSGINAQDNPTLYEAVIQRSYFADQLAAAFVELQKAGMNAKKYQALYESVIQNACYAGRLAAAFAELQKGGVNDKNLPTLYEDVVQNAEYADRLAAAFATLEQADISIENNLMLYETAIQNACNARKLAAAFAALKQGGISFQDHQALYAIVVHYADDADKLAAAFTALKQAGISFQDHPTLYEAVIPNRYYADKLSAAFVALKQASISFQDYPMLYEEVIQRAYNANQLAVAFVALTQASITIQAYSTLYEAVIKNSDHADTLAATFVALKQANINIHDHPALYEKVIRYAFKTEKLAPALAALGKAGINAQYIELYEAILQDDIYETDKMAAAFTELEQGGINAQNGLALYKKVIQHPYYAYLLVNAVRALKQADISIQDNQTLYEELSKTYYPTTELTTAFVTLKQGGISIQDYPTLYESVIDNIYYANKLATVFVTMKLIGISNQENQLELYNFVAKQIIADCFQLIPILNKIRQLALKAPDDFEIIDQALKAGAIGLDVLTWLQENKLQKDQHLYIYKAYFLGSTPLVRSPYNLAKGNCQLQDYFRKNPPLPSDDQAYGAQCLEVQQIIDKVLRGDNNITAGPLNKAAASREVEAILKRIAATSSIGNIHMRYTDTFGYLLRFEDEPEIYLSELLKLANFNHIELSEEQVNLLGNKIEDLSHDFNTQSIETTLRVVEMLPDAARRALNLYVGNKLYKNLNRLFRGVPLVSEPKYTWLTPVDSSNNLIANFLAGCLVNWAAAELPRKLLYGDERRQILEKVALNTGTPSSEIIEQMKASSLYYEQVLQEILTAGIITQDEYDKVASLFSKLSTLFPSYGLVDRGELLETSENDNSELSIEKRRLANPVSTPSVMSLSVLPDGSAYFHKPGTARTKIETDNSMRPVINKEEGEILAAQGTTYLYTQNPTGGFFAREINSPGITPKGDYWSSIAIAEAYRNHLSKPYQKATNQITIDGITIHRPNHGLAHEYRVMAYIDIVINYFAHHAKDANFRAFCQCITPNERQWLRVAAAYSRTWRENELSEVETTGEDLKLYDEARNAGKLHMEAFLAKYPPPSKDEAMRERMLDIVRWIGDPSYENEYQNKPAANQHTNTNEREHRNFINRILTLAHKLDLPRCYGPQQFIAAMAMARELVTQGPEQQKDYIRMIQYAIDLIDAHGSRLRTEQTPSGALIPCSKDYRPPFHKVSVNLRQLREITETIPYPKLTEQYQFAEQYQFQIPEPESEVNQSNRRACVVQ